MEPQELIKVEQLPIITERLKGLGNEIDEDIKKALSLECTEETVKEVKNTKSKLNKGYKAIEEKRKEVKNSIMEPYNRFEKVYKTYVTDKYTTADKILKDRISIVEDTLKNNKENEVKFYFSEYALSKNIDFINYERANINVTLSASLKSLKNQAKDFIDRIEDDLKIIEMQELKEEILVEYKYDLNVSNAITIVNTRHKAIEELKQRQIEQQERLNLEQEVINKVEEIASDIQQSLSPPIIEPQPENTEEKIYKVTFTVKGNKVQMKALKEFLIQGGYEYE